jgi:hypothetical protein
MANQVRDAVRALLAPIAFTPVDTALSSATAASPEELFDRAWNHTVLKLAIERLALALHESGEMAVFEVFRQHDLCESEPPPTYAEIGVLVGLTIPQVKHALRRARSELKAQAIELLRATTDRPADLAEELRAIFS